MLMLRVEPRFSARVVHSLNCWGISPALHLGFVNKSQRDHWTCTWAVEKHQKTLALYVGSGTSLVSSKWYEHQPVPAGTPTVFWSAVVTQRGCQIWEMTAVAADGRSGHAAGNWKNFMWDSPKARRGRTACLSPEHSFALSVQMLISQSKY